MTNDRVYQDIQQRNITFDDSKTILWTFEGTLFNCRQATLEVRQKQQFYGIEALWFEM